MKKDEEEKQMQLWHRETNELMVLEGISPLAIQSDKLLESCNEKKKNMDGNNLDDNITQIAQDVDLSPMQMEVLNSKQGKQTKKNKGSSATSATICTRSHTAKIKP